MIDSPFVVLIDHRERAGHRFAFDGLRADARQCRSRRSGSDGETRPTINVRVAVGHLVTGDYSLLDDAAGVDYRDRCAIERKALADLYGTIGQGRKRFTRELDRLSRMDFAAVVVEADWRTILEEPPPRSQLPPKVVFRSVLAWMTRYPGIHWFMATDRRLAEVTTYRLLEKYWQQQQMKRQQQQPAGVEQR